MIRLLVEYQTKSIGSVIEYAPDIETFLVKVGIAEMYKPIETKQEIITEKKPSVAEYENTMSNEILDNQNSIVKIVKEKKDVQKPKARTIRKRNSVNGHKK